MTDFAQENIGKMMTNVTIRLLAEDNGVDFNILIGKATKNGYWSELAGTFNRAVKLGYLPDYNSEDIEDEFCQLIIGGEDESEEIILKQTKEVQDLLRYVSKILTKIFDLM